MSHKRIISINPSQEELWDRAEAQGYVWIKTENGFVTTDELASYCRIETSLYKVLLSQKKYGRTWAFTEEELTGKTNKEEKE